MQTWWSVVAVVVVLGTVVQTSPTPLNERPIIGVLAQELQGELLAAVKESLGLGLTRERTGIRAPRSLTHIEANTLSEDVQEEQNQELPGSENEAHSPHHGDLPATPESYVAASYVKFVEAAGARVVPILINQDQQYYDDILASINGVLFPGGAVAIDETSGYGRAGKLIYNAAVRMNQVGDVFPVWGTCLGFELLMGLAAGGAEIRTSCLAQNTADHLKLGKGYAESRLFGHMPKRLMKALITKPVTANFHHFCVTPKNFTEFGVSETFRPLAYSCDKRGVEYVAAAEGRHLPFFAVQFHPEKAAFEWTTQPGHNHIPHTREAVHLSSFLADVFVNHARRSRHQFDNSTVEESSLIYNYPPVFTGVKSPLEQVYVF